MPAVTVGTRQQHRERGTNVIEVDHDSDEIASAIRRQLEHGRYERSTLFGTGRSGERIAEILAEVRPTIQKTLQLEAMNHELETI